MGNTRERPNFHLHHPPNGIKVIEVQPRHKHPGEDTADFDYFKEIDPRATIGKTGIVQSPMRIELSGKRVMEAMAPHDAKGTVVLQIPTDEIIPPTPPVERAFDPNAYRQGVLFEETREIKKPQTLPFCRYDTVDPEGNIARIHKKNEQLPYVRNRIVKNIKKRVMQNLLIVEARQGLG